MIDFPIELRFKEPRFNYLFVIILCFLLPSTISFSAMTFKSEGKKFIGMTLSFFLVFPCFLVFLFAFSTLKNLNEIDIDSSFEFKREVRVKDAVYRLYRTNGGATTAFGLVLREEKNFIKGIKTVKVLFNKYRASESTLTVLGDHAIEMKIEPYSKKEEVQVVRVNL